MTRDGRMTREVRRRSAFVVRRRSVSFGVVRRSASFSVGVDLSRNRKRTSTARLPANQEFMLRKSLKVGRCSPVGFGRKLIFCFPLNDRK